MNDGLINIGLLPTPIHEIEDQTELIQALLVRDLFHSDTWLEDVKIGKSRHPSSYKVYPKGEYEDRHTLTSLPTVVSIIPWKRIIATFMHIASLVNETRDFDKQGRTPFSYNRQSYNKVYLNAVAGIHSHQASLFSIDFSLVTDVEAIRVDRTRVLQSKNDTPLSSSGRRHRVSAFDSDDFFIEYERYHYYVPLLQVLYKLVETVTDQADTEFGQVLHTFPYITISNYCNIRFVFNREGSDTPLNEAVCALYHICNMAASVGVSPEANQGSPVRSYNSSIQTFMKNAAGCFGISDARAERHVSCRSFLSTHAADALIFCMLMYLDVGAQPQRKFFAQLLSAVHFSGSPSRGSSRQDISLRTLIKDVVKTASRRDPTIAQFTVEQVGTNSINRMFKWSRQTFEAVESEYNRLFESESTQHTYRPELISVILRSLFAATPTIRDLQSREQTGKRPRQLLIRAKLDATEKGDRRTLEALTLCSNISSLFD